MKSISIVLLAFLITAGYALADNYVGDAKGPDDPRAAQIGSNQSIALDLSGVHSMDLGSQALGKTGIEVIELSGTDPSVFLTPAFKKVGAGDGGSYGAWKPGM